MENRQCQTQNFSGNIDLTIPPCSDNIQNLALKNKESVRILLSKIESERNSYDKLLQAYLNLQSEGESKSFSLPGLKIALQTTWNSLDSKIQELKNLPLEGTDFNDYYDPDGAYDFGDINP